MTGMYEFYGITDEELQAVYIRIREVVIASTPMKAPKDTLDFAVTLTPRETFIAGFISGKVMAEAELMETLGLKL